MTTQSTSPVQKNPVDILQEQAICLSNIYQAQLEQLSLLRSQNEHLRQALKAIKRTAPLDFMLVNVENINMPFWDLVGFLLKLTFAWIPALIILGIFYFIIGLIIGGIIY